MPSAATLAVVPGPPVLYVVAHSIDGGTGGLVHVVAATVGISALVLSPATAFTAVTLARAAYPVGIGLHTLLARRRPDAETGAARPVRRLRRRSRRG